MEPDFITEEELIKHRNITICVATKPSTKLGSFIQRALTRVELKFCMGSLWNEMYGLSTRVKALLTVPVILICFHIIQLSPATKLISTFSHRPSVIHNTTYTVCPKYRAPEDFN